MTSAITSQAQKPQLQFEAIKDKLLLAISGKFHASDVADFMKAIDAKLENTPGLKKFVFDLRSIDPVYNAAGRVLDLADHYSRSEHAVVEVDMQEEVYSTLSLLPKHYCMHASGSYPTVPGLWVRLWKRESQTLDLKRLPTESFISTPKLLLACTGKVTEISDSEVTVTLFTPEEEIIGELARTQFPPAELFPGMIFSYKAIVSKPGLTEVSIDLVPEQQPSDEALMDMAKEVRERLGNVDLNEI